MNSLVCVLLLAAVVAAEPQQYRSYYRFARQELETGPEKEATTARNEEAPYPAAGYKPSKEFNLPSRQEVSPPATSYGVPDDSYGAPLRTITAPHVEYGIPTLAPEAKNSEGEEKKEGETEAEGEKKEDTESKADKDDAETNAKLEEEPKKETEVVSNQGFYYVLLPGAQLQRVQFQTENDISKMAYTARLQYSNEDRAPLYVYTAVPQYQSAAYVQLY